MAYNVVTTGLNTAAKVVITSPFNGKGYQVQELSVSQASPDSSGYQIEAQVQDLAGSEQLGTVLTLSAVANFSGTSPADTVYTVTITNGANNAFVGYIFVVAGFTNPVNNGTFQCVASTSTTLTLANPLGIAQTQAATATFANSPSTSPYVNPLTFWSSNPKVATVTSDGFIQGLAVGKCTVEVSYPFADNNLGTVPGGTGNPSNLFGWPQEKIYTEISVKVLL